MQQNKTEFIRIIWAIAAKDIADALKNKRTLSTVVMVVFLMLLYRWIPVLWEGERTEIVVYDPGGSRLTPALEAAPGFRPRLVASRDEFEMYFNDGDEGPLGLVVPADFEETLARGEQPTLAGYVLWDRRFSSAALAADYEQRLSALIGQPIAIQIEGTVYPEPASMGAVRMIALMLLIAPLFIGMLTVPHLLLEERRTKTLDTLLVSPASVAQVVAGKALAGLFYVLTASVVVLAFNWTFVVHGGLAGLAIGLGALLAVGLGLLLGVVFENRQTLNTWTMIIMQPLLIPAFLSMIDPILPEKLRTALAWVPTVSLTLLFRYSFTDGAAPGDILLYALLVLATALVVLSAVVWRVRGMDR